MAVVARMVARLEAETSDFHVRMTAAETQLGKWSNSTVSGTRATRLLEHGLQQLSFQAAGIPGPIGKVASAIGMLGVGGGPVLVATAALGLLALAYKEIADASALAAKAQEDFFEALKKTPQGALSLGRNALKDAKDQLRSLTAPGATGPGGAAIPEAMIEAARMKVANLTVALGPLQKAADDAAKRQTKEIERQNEELRKQAALVALLLRLRAVPLGPLGTVRLPGLPTDDLGRGAGAPGALVPIRFRDRFGHDIGVKDLPSAPGGQAPETAPGGGNALQIAQMAVASVMMVAQGGGNMLGAGGMLVSGLSAMKGIGTAAGPLGWMGLALTTLGSIFSSKSDEAKAQRERLHRELIGVLREGPARITQYFEGDAEQSRYENRRLERLGGEPRNGGM